MKVLIDADGCPVVDCSIALAGEFSLPCVLICDSAHVFERAAAQTITVDQGADSVDFRLVNLIEAGDVVVTQDYGLAAMCLARGARALNQNGLVFCADNMDALLLQRHTAKKIRMAGGRLKGNAKRSPEQDAAFLAALRNILGE